MNRRLCFQIWGVDKGGGVGLPSLVSSFPLGAARAKFSFFPSLHYFYICSPLFLLALPLFPPPLLPLTMSVPSNVICMIADRQKIRSLRWREGTVDVLRSTAGRLCMQEEYRIDDRTTTPTHIYTGIHVYHIIVWWIQKKPANSRYVGTWLQ